MPGSRGHARSPGAAIAIGAVVGLALGIVVSLTTSVPLAPDATPARLEAVDVVFQSFNRCLGVAVDEHLGYA